MNRSIEKILAPLLKCQDNKILKAYHHAHGNILGGLILISSLILLSKGCIHLIGQDFGIIPILKDMYAYVNVFALILIAYDFASHYQTSPYSSIILSLFSFFMIGHNFETVDINSLTSYSLVMLIPLLSQLLINGLHCMIVKINIKKPTKFPDKILSLIEEMIVFLIAILIFVFLNNIFTTQVAWFISMYLRVSSTIFSLYQNPLIFLAILLVLNLIWYSGFHGDQVLSIWFEPIIIIFTLFNIGSVIGVADKTYIINASFYTAFSGVTGSGITGAILVNLILSRKKDLEIVRSSFVPAIFNINETVMFGLPIVGNKTFKIPFLFAPLIAASLAYLATYFGLMKPFMFAVPWYFPIGIKSFIATGGHLPSVLIELSIFMVIVLLYLPASRRYIRELQ